MSKKYTIKKYNGDDIYSWAVFRTEDVKGIASPVSSDIALPLISGLSRFEAQKIRDERNNKH